MKIGAKAIYVCMQVVQFPFSMKNIGNLHEHYKVIITVSHKTIKDNNHIECTDRPIRY